MDHIHIINVKKTLAKDNITLVALFRFGSRIYGTNTEESDHDFVCIVPNEDTDKRVERKIDKDEMGGGVGRDTDSEDKFIYKVSIDEHEYDLHLRTVAEFQNLLDEQDFPSIEAFFNPVEFELIDKHKPSFIYTIDKAKFRQKLGSYAHHTNCKAMKKIVVARDRDFYVAKRSLFHSIKIYILGTRLISTGNLADFSGLKIKDLFTEIMTLDEPEAKMTDEDAKTLWNNWDSSFLNDYGFF
jgi:predicted nucleotidyltransferase